jgi:hypothetical protein
MQNTLLPGSIVVKQQQQNAYPITLPQQGVSIGQISQPAILQLRGANYIVGSSIDVANGFAGYTSLVSALALATAGQVIALLNTYNTVENVIVSASSISIIGMGHTANINGTFTVNGNYGSFFGFRISSSIIFNGTGCFMGHCWQATGQTINSGVNNELVIVQE